AAASGTNAISASMAEAPSAYTAGQSFKIKAAATNTGPVTLNIDGLGARNVKKMGESGKESLEAGDIVSGGIYTVDYDGSEFILSGGVHERLSMVLLDTQESSVGVSALEFVT